MNKILIAVFLFCATSLFSQERRLALVIGNGEYEQGGVLRNPVNDARAMKAALARTGFVVLDHYNLDQGDMKRAIDDFGLKLRGYDVGLFFYAGHGIQSDGLNYFIPVDANLIAEQDIEYDCVPANRVLGKMDASNADVKIMILDACRNNPFERGWHRSSNGQGLAFMTAPSGTLIAYATAPGSIASDGTGENGLYTEAILESMAIPEFTIIELFQNVRNLVSRRSHEQQIPWESTSLVGNFYFAPGAAVRAASQTTARVTETPVTTEMTVSEAFEPPVSSNEGSFSDARDDRTYRWIRIGEQVWMAENLSYDAGVGSWYYDEDERYGKNFGRLYNFETASGACPDGWHLPSDEEWKTLELHLGMSLQESDAAGYHGVDEGKKLKSTNGWIKGGNGSNESGFNAKPGGFRSDDGKFVSTDRYATFWSSSPYNQKTAWYRLLGFHRDRIGRVKELKTYSYSVRCLKDTTE